MADTFTSGYCPVNGLSLYYEIHGKGEPLILLHGGACSTESFGELLPSLATVRQVIAVDLQAHGRTADIDRPLCYHLMADDIAALLKHLKIAGADLMGYSLGGGVALRTAIQHPAITRKLVIVSAVCKHKGWFAEIRAAMVQFSPEKVERMKQSELYQTYARTAPRPEDWALLFRKLSEMMRQDYDWTSDVAHIAGPTLLAFGDADSVYPDHIMEFFELLGGGKRDGGWVGAGVPKARLAILPGVTHYNICSAPALLAAVTSFLAE